MQESFMINNDILRRIRYALDLSDTKMISLFKQAQQNINHTELKALLKKEEEEGFTECKDRQLSAFLDALIVDRRGPRDPNSPQPKPNVYALLSNNDILRKLRIALELQEKGMLSILALGGMKLSPSELSALFRNKKHRHYKTCGDQLLRNFLNGLTKKLRNV